MNREQRDRLVQRSLAVLRNYVVEVPQAAPSTPAPAQREEVAAVQVSPAARLSSDASVLLRRVAELPPELLDVSAAALGWDRMRHFRARDENKMRGLLTEENLGNKRVLMALSEAGTKLAIDCEWCLLRDKSGVRHRFLAGEFRRCSLAAFGEGVRFYTTGIAATISSPRPVQVDLLVVPPDGRRIAMQASVENTVKAEVDALLALDAAPDLQHVAFVTAKREKREAVRKALKAAGVSSTKVALLEIEQLLDEEFNLRRALGLVHRDGKP